MPIQPYQLAPQPQSQDAQASDPTPAANQGTSYVKTVSGKRELFFKNDAGDVVQITANGQVVGGSLAEAFEKPMVNGDVATIPAGKPVSIKGDGSYVLGDSDSADGQEPVGITLASVAVSAVGSVALFGRNMPGVLTGLGFAPGDDIFIDEASGQYTNTVAGFTGDDDSIVRIGVAAAANGVTSANATDLIMMREVLIRP